MKKILMTALALTSLFATAVAQETGAQGQVLELTLEQAIEIALNDNPLIQVANLEIERQDYVRKETIGNHLPTLSASGQYSYSIVKQKMSRDGLSFGADNTVALAANLTVPLFAPGVYASLKLNQSQMEAAVESARASKLDMVNEVRKAYYNILLAEQSLVVLEESVTMIEETVEHTQNMYNSGLASEYDLLTAQVQLSNLQPTIISTRNAIEISKMMLKMLLSIPQEYEIAVLGSLDEFSDQILYGNTMYTTDVIYNSDLRMLDIQEQMLNHQIKLINSQRMPVIAAFGQISLAGSDLGSISFMSETPQININPADYPNFTVNQIQDLGSFMGNVLGQVMGSDEPAQTGFWWQHPASVGLQISVPIFSGNKHVNQVKQTRNTLSQLNMQRDYMEQAIKVQAQSSINNIMTAREKMFANEKTVAQAQKAYDITEARYGAGAGTILELNSAQLSLVQAQLNYSQAIYDYLAAEADYEKTIGIEYWEYLEANEIN